MLVEVENFRHPKMKWLKELVVHSFGLFVGHFGPFLPRFLQGEVGLTSRHTRQNFGTQNLIYYSLPDYV